MGSQNWNEETYPFDTGKWTRFCCQTKKIVISRVGLLILQRGLFVAAVPFSTKRKIINCIQVPHCSKTSFFVQKFNFDFPRKLSIFLGKKLVKMLWFWTF